MILSDIEKKEMLEDAHSTTRRADFRKMRALQESRPVSMVMYCDFVSSMQRFFGVKKQVPVPSQGKWLL